MLITNYLIPRFFAVGFIVFGVALASCDSQKEDDGELSPDISVHPCPVTLFVAPGGRGAAKVVELRETDGSYVTVVDTSFDQTPSWLTGRNGGAGGNGGVGVYYEATSDAPLGDHQVGRIALQDADNRLAYCNTNVSVVDNTAGIVLSVERDTVIHSGEQIDLTVTSTWPAPEEPGTSLSVEGLPPGVVADIQPAILEQSVTESATLTLTNVGAQAGTYEASVVGHTTQGYATRARFLLEVVDQQPSGWNVVLDASSSGSFRDMDFPSGNVGYAVGQSVTQGPVAYKTDDGGETWSSLSVPASHEILVVSFFDENVGFVGGGKDNDGFLLKTTDGGTTWTDATTTMPATVLPRAIVHLDATTWMVGGGSGVTGTSVSNSIMLTDDGGVTWTAIDGPWTNNLTQRILAMHFWSIDAGYVSHQTTGGSTASSVHFTTDGGENWGTAANGNFFTRVLGGLAVADTDKLYSTSDGGASWSEEMISGPGPFVQIAGLANVSGSTWLVGKSSNAFVTRRVAGAWQTDWNEGLGGTVQGLVDVAMFSETDGVALGLSKIVKRYP